ncbi:MAG: AAA family ATPase [Cyclobacteriaceae bacterium]
MTKNPFKFGEIVGEGSFCNRTKEIARLKQAFSDSQNVVLISPRRWGKSSLVDESIARHKGKLLVAAVDCFGITSSEQFLEVYLKAVLKSESKLTNIVKTAKEFLQSMAPYISFSVGESEEIKIGLSLPRGKFDPTEILALPQRIAEARGIPFLICVDEFQKIQEWPEGGKFLEKLRSVWQKHQKVSYCLYGSKRHLMSGIFNDSSKPFFRFGDTLFLEKISSDHWVKFIAEQFSGSGKKITEQVATLLVEMVKAHSYYVQYLCRLCWGNAEKEVTESVVRESFDQLLADMLNLFRAQTEHLTRYQVNYLTAFISGERKMSSNRVINHYQLGSQGNIKRIEKSLQDSEIMDFFTGEPELNEPYFEPLFRKHFIGNS